MTVTARLELVRVAAGKVTAFGPVDGRFSFRLVGAAVQPSLTIVEGPLLNLKESGDPSRVTITWRTDSTATAKARIAAAGRPHMAVAASAADQVLVAGLEFAASPGRNHEVSVTGLSPSTRYQYLVESQAPDGTLARSPLYSFTTAPRAGKSEESHRSEQRGRSFRRGSARRADRCPVELGASVTPRTRSAPAGEPRGLPGSACRAARAAYWSMR